MHAEAGLFTVEISSNSSFVNKDMEVAASVSLEEGLRPDGKRIANPDGSSNVTSRATTGFKKTIVFVNQGFKRTDSVMELKKTTTHQESSQYYWIFPGGAVCLSVTTDVEVNSPPSVADDEVKLKLSLDPFRPDCNQLGLSHNEAYICAGQLLVKKNK